MDLMNIIEWIIIIGFVMFVVSFIIALLIFFWIGIDIRKSMFNRKSR